MGYESNSESRTGAHDTSTNGVGGGCAEAADGSGSAPLGTSHGGLLDRLLHRVHVALQQMVLKHAAALGLHTQVMGKGRGKGKPAHLLLSRIRLNLLLSCCSRSPTSKILNFHVC